MMLLEDDIRVEAYWIWLDDGRVHGRDRDHWWQAEGRLRDAVSTRTVIRTCHDTVLYLDDGARQIRHAALGAVADKDAVIGFEEDGLRLATLRPEDTIAIDAEGCLSLVAADQEEGAVDYAIEHRDGGICVAFGTGFLSAEPGGRVVTTKAEIGDCERFELVPRAWRL